MNHGFKFALGYTTFALTVLGSVYFFTMPRIYPEQTPQEQPELFTVKRLEGGYTEAIRRTRVGNTVIMCYSIRSKEGYAVVSQCTFTAVK